MTTTTNRSELNQVTDSMEHMDHHNEDHMSPFLPELDNDPLLHPEHHLIDHTVAPNDQESNDTISTTKPPNLEFDQLNHTNPFDNNTSDAFKVVPLIPNLVQMNETIMGEQQMNESSTESKLIFIVLYDYFMLYYHMSQV